MVYWAAIARETGGCSDDGLLTFGGGRWWKFVLPGASSRFVHNVQVAEMMDPFDEPPYGG
jgi:hypothetical protein